jgi:hypothetical protein
MARLFLYNVIDNCRFGWFIDIAQLLAKATQLSLKTTRLLNLMKAYYNKSYFRSRVADKRVIRALTG